MIKILHEKLSVVVERQRRLEAWSRLARVWAAAGLLGLILAVLERAMGWSSWVAMPLVVLAALLLAAAAFSGRRDVGGDSRKIARTLEAEFPELDGRLLTAVQQKPADGQELNYLQTRLVQEALGHGQRHDWPGFVSNRRLALAQTVHWAALGLLGVVLFQLRPTAGEGGWLVARPDASVTVTPGDTRLERGSPLVVVARFSGALPPTVELVIDGPAQSTRLPLVKSLADPMFGGTVSEVASNFAYYVDYAGHRTREFSVTVFEYPRLQKADVDVSYPAYTGQPRQHIQDTRRLSAVEGSSLDLTLQLNKPVRSARLVSRSTDHRVIPLRVTADRPVATLEQFTLDASQVYDLQLLDDEGRTNKVPAQFGFDALKNRPPEIRLATPRGDLRPSALEEIPFTGSVWDDFGVKEYGIGYAVAGRPTEFLSLGKNVAGKQKEQFQYLLHLEDLKVQPDELVSWFVWADNLGPDGNLRRTVGDLFFGEVRPFDEVFREGQGMDGQGQEQAGESNQGNQTARLAELQKQIISATWNLQRRQEHPAAPAPGRKPLVEPGPESRYSRPTGTTETLAHLSPRSRRWPQPGILGHLAGQLAPPETPSPGADLSADTSTRQPSGPPAEKKAAAADDLGVIRDSQAQALEQAATAAERARDPRTEALWSAATKQMEQALDQLRRADSPSALRDALAAEQGAYQALLKLQEHEYQVARQRRQSQGGGRQQQMERQLEQMDLTQSQDRYENQRQAQAPQNSQKREQLQVMNRLQELARRQTDLNDRLKELQSALQEAKTDEERAELQRRLKRLEEEERQMLADVDELRQRMDRPENQSRMADERRQLEQTRQDVQRAAEAASQGSPSQALAAGTRAERQLQQTRDQMRKENSSQFAEDLRSMRAQARELANQQQAMQQALQQDAGADHRSLADATPQKSALDQLGRQKELLTNLVDRASQISQQAESSEPLLSSQLYDTIRKFSQESSKNVNELQNQLINQGLMPQSLMDSLKDASEPDGAKLLDVASEMLRRDFTPQGRQALSRAGERINDLKTGIERAAQSVLGDDTEALRLAEQELDQLTGQLQREMSQAEPGSNQTNQAPGRSVAAGTGQPASERTGTRGQRDQAGASEQSGTRQAADQSPAQAPQPGAPGNPSATQENRHGNNSAAESAQNGSGNPSPGPDNNQSRSEQARSGGGRPTSSSDAGGARLGGNDSFDSASGGGVGGGGWNFDRLLNDQAWRRGGPLTGEDFTSWSDRLREVEEIVEAPDLKNEVAAARERARLLRQEFKRARKKPDWAVVRTQVMTPLTQVRDRIADELARRRPGDALVPIDRDPVPNQYSELVRRYYEELGKDK